MKFGIVIPNSSVQTNGEWAQKKLARSKENHIKITVCADSFRRGILPAFTCI